MHQPMNQPLHGIGFSLLPVSPLFAKSFVTAVPVLSTDAIVDYACINHNTVFPLHVCAASVTGDQTHT